MRSWWTGSDQLLHNGAATNIWVLTCSSSTFRVGAGSAVPGSRTPVLMIRTPIKQSSADGTLMSLKHKEEQAFGVAGEKTNTDKRAQTGWAETKHPSYMQKQDKRLCARKDMSHSQTTIIRSSNWVSWKEICLYLHSLIFESVSDVVLPRAQPHLLIGCSLLPSMSGLGGGAENVLKLRDRGREEGREACLRRSPSSI